MHVASGSGMAAAIFTLMDLKLRGCAVHHLIEKKHRQSVFPTKNNNNIITMFDMDLFQTLILDSVNMHIYIYIDSNLSMFGGVANPDVGLFLHQTLETSRPSTSEFPQSKGLRVRVAIHRPQCLIKACWNLETHIKERINQKCFIKTQLKCLVSKLSHLQTMSDDLILKISPILHDAKPLTAFCITPKAPF